MGCGRYVDFAPGALLGRSNEPLASVGRFKAGVPLIIRMRALLIVTRLFQMGVLCGSGRKFGGFVDLDLGKPAVLLGAGIGFMTHLRFLQIE